jgi:hypothetical protein
MAHLLRIPSNVLHSKPKKVIIVGGRGNVGQAFSALLPPCGATLCVNRNQNLTEIVHNSPENTPILVCTTNDALSQVISATPTARREDLIFLQNGMLLPELSRFNLQHSATQVLLYLAAGNDGLFKDGKQTVCIGKWAQWFSNDVLLKNNLACRVVSDPNEYKVLMVHKLLWACIFWMMSAALGGATVGQIVETHRKEVADLVKELLCSVITSITCTSDGGEQEEQQIIDSCIEAVIAYSLCIPDAVPSREMALKEFKWRNGWFLELEQHSFESKLHREWLRRAGVGG